MSRAKPIGAGKSGFELIDSDRLFRQLDLQAGTIFLDVACGKGADALMAADLVGSTGMVSAVDLWEEGIEGLNIEIAQKNIKRIKSRITIPGIRISPDCSEVF
jgi:ubiquinone/menaquinone biosynthesis C-methylase UbiE